MKCTHVGLRRLDRVLDLRELTPRVLRLPGDGSTVLLDLGGARTPATESALHRASSGRTPRAAIEGGLDHGHPHVTGEADVRQDRGAVLNDVALGSCLH